MADYLEPYRKAVADGGATFESLLWKNRDYQQLRFAVFADSIDLTGRVVADMGCGRADLAVWLHAQGIEFGGYVGVEGVAELAAAAREEIAQHGIDSCEIVEADFAADSELAASLVRSRGVDTILFSGSLNTFDEDDAIAVLERTFAALSRGGVLAFNFLSDQRREPRAATGPANRFDTVRLTAWALKQTESVVLRHDYLRDHDATIVMRSV